MNIRSILNSKKALWFGLFLASILGTLLIFQQPRAIAQGDFQSFLNGVSQSVANSCRQQGDQCSACAGNIARGYIQQYRIFDQRTQQAVYNAAIAGCS